MSIFVIIDKMIMLTKHETKHTKISIENRFFVPELFINDGIVKRTLIKTRKEGGELIRTFLVLLKLGSFRHCAICFFVKIKSVTQLKTIYNPNKAIIKNLQSISFQRFVVSYCAGITHNLMWSLHQ